MQLENGYRKILSNCTRKNHSNRHNIVKVMVGLFHNNYVSTLPSLKVKCSHATQII